MLHQLAPEGNQHLRGFARLVQRFIRHDIYRTSMRRAALTADGMT